jgi:hypothetical protein
MCDMQKCSCYLPPPSRPPPLPLLLLFLLLLLIFRRRCRCRSTWIKERHTTEPIDLNQAHYGIPRSWQAHRLRCSALERCQRRSKAEGRGTVHQPLQALPADDAARVAFRRRNRVSSTMLISTSRCITILLTVFRYLIVRFDEETGDARYAHMRPLAGSWSSGGLIEFQAWTSRNRDAIPHHESDAVVQNHE